MSEGLARAVANADPWDMEPALAAVRFLAGTGRDFEAYDVTEQCGIELVQAGQWGALFAVAVQRGLIVHSGYGRSRRPSRSGGLTRFWRGAVE